MQNILFLNRKTEAKAEVRRIGEHLIEIKGNVGKNTSGFHIKTDSGEIYGKYEDYTTLYREIEGGFVLSNDGSVYAEPEPVPEPEPYEPSLEEVQEDKVQEMNEAQQAAIQEGINVTLTDGTVEHFTLTDHDQTSLVGLQSRVMAGEEEIPWHNSNEGFSPLTSDVNGIFKHSSGLMLQWGIYPSAAMTKNDGVGGYLGKITFKESFTGTPQCFTTCHYWGGNTQTGTQDISSTSVTLFSKASATDLGVRWLALGSWK